MEARAAVQVGARQIETRTFPVPDEFGEDEALLEIEGCGLCGTDWSQYQGQLKTEYPLIFGHEIVGRIAEIGAHAEARLGFKVGDRIALNGTLSCGRCAECLRGNSIHCHDRMTYGLTAIANAPALSGGYAEYLVMRPNTQGFRLPDALSIEDAVFFNPLASGFDWTLTAGGLRFGETVLIMGPGQRGLACVIAANEAGAGRIIVAGRGRRPWKLDLARQLGATDVINTDEASVVDVVSEITGGAGADLAIDTSPTSAAVKPIEECIAALRAEGRLVLIGHKNEEVPEFMDKIISKALTVRGAYGSSAWSTQQAIRVISAGKYDFSALHTHTLSIDKLDYAMRILGGEVEGEEAIHITVTPH